jgi:hypothetical protein
MLKPNGTFKLSKTSKRMLCNFANKEERGHWKRMMIQAELAEKIVIKSAPKRDSGTVYKTPGADADQPVLVYK